ncbi:hypothetical protein KC19_12G178800 [Ceratodon purpureus]|uniref:Uncharacterized protein n=1 Tax=Ceratodon purpureus TaxID=3225 RepID=A0A8T0GC40_CERPU|nr:hypothetical protein KC19_12G178800 [Ceratodon purpureus]
MLSAKQLSCINEVQRLYQSRKIEMDVIYDG